MNEARSKPDLVVMDAVACCLLLAHELIGYWISEISPTSAASRTSLGGEVVELAVRRYLLSAQ